MENSISDEMMNKGNKKQMREEEKTFGFEYSGKKNFKRLIR